MPLFRYARLLTFEQDLEIQEGIMRCRMPDNPFREKVRIEG